jgi:antitoxin VapB
MALNIKNPEVERLATEVARLAGESKTEAIRRALVDRKARLDADQPLKMSRGERLQRFLETEVWPFIPPEERGKRMTKEEREEILGYGPDGV